MVCLYMYTCVYCIYIYIYIYIYITYLYYIYIYIFVFYQPLGESRAVGPELGARSVLVISSIRKILN